MSNVSIPLSDILYVEALGNYVKIVRMSGGHVLTRTNLKNVMELLPSGIFLRIHRSYVIALAAVVSYTRVRVFLRGGNFSLPIGQLYADSVCKVLGGKC